MTKRQHTRTDYAPRIARALAHMDKHLAGDLSLDRLADVAALSRFHFSRVFRAQTGEGVAEAVRRVRLNRAALLLVGTQDSVEEVAVKTGFGHVGSFERAFSTAFCCSPKQAQKRSAILPPLLPPEKGVFAMFPTEVREGEEIILAALPHKGAYQGIGAVFEALAKGLAERDLWKGSGPSIGIYYDDPSETPVDELRSHAGQRLPAGVAVPDAFDRVVLGAGKFMVVTCTGPFTKLPEAWGYAYGQAMPEGGHAFREGLPYERYVSNTWETAPEEYVTEIWVPIQ